MGPRLRLKSRTCFREGKPSRKPAIPARAWAPQPKTERISGSGLARCLACTTPWPPAVRMVVMLVAPTRAMGEPVARSLRMTRLPWLKG